MGIQLWRRLLLGEGDGDAAIDSESDSPRGMHAYHTLHTSQHNMPCLMTFFAAECMSVLLSCGRSFGMST
jgi:hypothetical protein